MKKPYCKPQISFEDFELCANIALGCEHPTNHQQDVCAYESKLLGGAKIFLQSVTACEYKQQEGAFGLCYHFFINNNNIFTS